VAELKHYLQKEAGLHMPESGLSIAPGPGAARYVLDRVKDA
jgi:hypothetical protein